MAERRTLSMGHMRIRDVEVADLARVHALNEAAVPHVNSISLEAFDYFTGEASYFRVAQVAEGLAGFLVAFAPGAAYDSPNYRWFECRYSDFLYIDRVTVAEVMRGRGIAASLYRDLQEYARPRAAMLTCEVNTRPRNEESLAFHRRFGFESVGSQQTEGGAKTVSLMIKNIAGRARPAS